MGTSYQIKISSYQQDQTTKSQSRHLLNQAYGQLKLVDTLMSSYKKDSDIGRFNNAKVGEKIYIDGHTAYVIEKALEIHKSSLGAFDITIGSLVNKWGFGPSPTSPMVPKNSHIQQTLKSVGIDSFSINLDTSLNKFYLVKLVDGVELDLSAIAKGYSLDLVAKLFDDQQIYNYFIDVGGEIRTKGMKEETMPWKVVLELPIELKHEIAKIIHPKNISLATSGNYRNFFVHNKKLIHHTIDPKTGHPAENTLGSITVAHADCMIADAWATALNVLGLDKGLEVAKKFNLDVLFIIKKGTQYANEFEYIYTGKFKELIGH